MSQVVRGAFSGSRVVNLMAFSRRRASRVAVRIWHGSERRAAGHCFGVEMDRRVQVLVDLSALALPLLCLEKFLERKSDTDLSKKSALSRSKCS